MRRSDREQSLEFSLALIDRCQHGTVAFATEDGAPYCIPLSLVRVGDKLYFHCAQSGHKIDAISRNAKASFCVIDQDQIVPEEYTSYFRSIIAFGTIRILEDSQEKREAIEKLAVKYAPDDNDAHRQAAIDRDWVPLCMLEMTIEHMTGKEAKELIKEKQQRNKSC